jgi:uncharacterized protein (UPF0335 family)
MTESINKDTAEKLKKYIEGIEMYEDQKKEIGESIKEIYDEAKSSGFDVKIIRKIISLRKKDKNKLEEEEFLLETYKEALGMN